MDFLPKRIAQAFGAALFAWLIVGTALWTLGGPTGGTALEVAIACTLAAMVGIWWVSGRSDTPWPGLVAIHALAALLFGSLMVVVTYSLEAAAAGSTLAEAARSARFLGAQFVFWIWLYAVLAAGSYWIRLQATLRDEREATARSEARLAEAQLASLRGQLNPHFLFNALHGVNALVQENPAAASAALEQLGDLLRYSLDEGDRATVELREELRFARAYLGLMSPGLGDRLRVTVDLDETLLDVPVPPFSLQVLVENAVRHGVAPRPEGGSVDIGVRRTEGGVELAVDNDAVGPGPPSPPAAPGKGLANLRARLDVLYGGGARLDAGATDGRFRARILVPGR